MTERKKPGPEKRFTARLRDIRITETALNDLRAVANASGSAVSDVVRDAIDMKLRPYRDAKKVMR